MPLPGILYPSTLPRWRVDQYNVAPQDVYAQVPMSTGHARVRRVFTTHKRIDRVHLTLSAERMAIFHDWFENVLQAGLQPFSALMGNLGPGLLWFEVRFLGTYRADPVPGAYWQVYFDLLVTGDGQEEPPDTSELGFAMTVPVEAVAELTVETSLAFDMLVPVLAFVGETTLAFDMLVPVLAEVVGPADGRITEDGDSRITEDGDERVTEEI